MFVFPNDTNIEIDKNLVFKTFNQGKETSDAKNIENVFIQNIINTETTKLKSNDNFSLIYVVVIELKERKIPYEFLTLLDKQIEFPVIYKLLEPEEFNISLIIPVKNDKLKCIRIFNTGWMCEFYEFNNIESYETIENFYKMIIEFFTNLKFLNNETVESYINRLIKINDNENVDKGYLTYNSIENKYRVLLNKCVNINNVKIKITDFGNFDYIKTKKGKKRFSNKLKYEFEKIIYDEPFAHLMPRKGNDEKFDIAGEFYKQISWYFTLINTRKSHVELYCNDECYATWINESLARMIWGGCRTRYINFENFNIYEFIEIKHKEGYSVKKKKPIYIKYKP